MNEKNKRIKPKILLVANVAKEFVLKFHVPTLKLLSEEGWVVDVACAGKEVIPYCNCQYVMSYERSPFTTKTLRGIRELKNIIDRENYDIIYCHTPVGGVAGRLAAVSARKKGTKVVYFAHGYHFYNGAPMKNWILYYSIEKLMAKLTDAFILINDEDYEVTVKKFGNARVYKIDGIGVDLNRFNVKNKEEIRKQYREKNDIPEDAIVMIYLAELIANKNQTLLMDVLKILLRSNKKTYLVLAGYDHTNGYFAKYADKIGVANNVRFLGWREDVGNLYAMSDICTASSIREGFGLNLVEAMVCGVPIVATKNRGHETIISDGVNGFLVDAGAADKFAKSIELLLEDDKIKQSFVHEGYKEIGKYSGENITIRIRDILQECIESG